MTGTTTLGTVRDGIREHRPGWDLTLSAPKSVSVLALVAGDRRLLDAQERAAGITFAYAERHAAVTRIRQGDEVERIASDNLVIAAFPHMTARGTEDVPAPQVHTHGVILNMTHEAGEWRSIESRPLYRLQKELGGIYHQALAAEIIQLGYTVSINPDGTFEVDGVPLDVRQAFSARSAQIEAALEARGQSRKTASAAEKAVVALDTRSPKEAVDRRELVHAWRASADRLGFTEDKRRALVAGAEARAAGLPVPTAQQRREAADKAVAAGAAHLAERESTFSAARLERAAGDAGQGRVAHAYILAAITRAERRHDIETRAVPGAAKGTIGFTTREAIQTEQRMLALEAEGRTRFDPLYEDREKARAVVAMARLKSAEHGHDWTRGQVDATKALLQSRAFVNGVQGAAGTAKTTTVLATYADAARDQGLAVRALAPTATAADVLGHAIGATPMTVARMLGNPGDDIEQGREVWIIDEASMLGARDTEALLERAREAGARIVLVGDTAQLGSVEAGRAFGQLEEHGMATARLEEIVRQTNPETRRAVEAMLERDAGKAFEALDAGGGAVREYLDTPTRQAIIAHDFARLSREERARTLVLDPTRQGRQDLTDAIRAALVRDGTLGEEALVATVLEPRGLTRTEAARATSYQPGDIVTFRHSEKGRPRPGTGYRVEAVDTETGTVRLVPPKGKTHDWQPARWGSAHAEAFAETPQEFRSGDRIQFTRNNYRADRLNGHTAEVLAIDTQTASMVVAREDGRRKTLDMTHLADRHIRPGWVRTIHSSQGATCDRVFAHVESYRANTVDARSVYVAISRARSGATLYTDSRPSLIEALGLRDGSQVGAIDQITSINLAPENLIAME